MFKNALLTYLLRQCFCLFVAGILLVGQLPDLPRLLTPSTVSELKSFVGDVSPSECFTEGVDVDEGSDLLPVIAPEISFSCPTELPLQGFSSQTLLSSAGFGLPPLARPPPVIFTC